MGSVRTRLLLVGPGEGESVDLGGLGVHFKIRGRDTAGSIAIVEHPIEPRRLVPPHTHTKEDELSYILEGTVGVRIGDEIAEAVAGSYVFKPRAVPHTFWNPTDRPAAARDHRAGGIRRLLRRDRPPLRVWHAPGLAGAPGDVRPVRIDDLRRLDPGAQVAVRAQDAGRALSVGVAAGSTRPASSGSRVRKRSRYPMRRLYSSFSSASLPPR